MESKKQSPSVSVVISCHSVPIEYVREAIESVMIQTMSDWEAIVIDDGGLDFSVDELARSIGDPRIQVVRHPENRGLGAARNTGFEKARAPLVALLDADDVLLADYLRLMTAALADSRLESWVWPDIEVFGSSSGEWRFPESPIVMCPAHMNYRGGSSLIPVSLWKAVGGFAEDRRLAGLEDMEFWLGALEIGATPVYLHEVVYRWRTSPESMTFRVSPESHLQMKDIYRRRRPVFERASPCPECGRAKPGAVLVARGYFNASVHARRSGKRLRSLRFGCRAWLSNPHDAGIKRNLAALVVPGRLAPSRGVKS